MIKGHVGFPKGLREAWRLLPERQTVEVRLWHEPADAIPAGRDRQIDWLFGWWGRLDAWVDERERARALADAGPMAQNTSGDRGPTAGDRSA